MSPSNLSMPRRLPRAHSIRGIAQFMTPLVAFLLCSCHRAGVLDPQGPISDAERLILINATAIMLVVVVPVIAMTLFFAWRYRAGNRRAVYRPEWSYSGQIELVVWAVPTMVVILLSGVAIIGSHQLDPARKIDSALKPIRIEVVSLDWKWLFIYPDHRIATVNQLTVPLGTPIEFTLTSATVMNAFFIPQLGSQIYTMPGMTTHLYLLAARSGDYAGFSSHFSGDGFSDMHFVVRAVADGEFNDWIAESQKTTGVLDEAGYWTLARAGISTPQTYGRVNPGMFDRIVQFTAPMTKTQSKEL